VKRRRRGRGGGGGRPQTHGLAWVLSWAVATSVTWAISLESAKVCPARACRRKIRHPASCRFSQQAPLGMNTCSMRGCPASQARVATLEWLERLSVITTSVPVGLACSSRERNACQEALLRDGAQQVTACPSAIRRPP